MNERPMPPEIDIFRTATLLVKAHGGDAPKEAARRAGEMLERKHLDEAAMWLRVGIAAETLLAESGAVPQNRPMVK